MSDHDRKTKVSKGAGIHEGAARAEVMKDPRAAKLLAAGRGLGNAELQSRLDSGKATRDEMLAYLTQHLKLCREAQNREIAATDPHKMREAYPLVSDKMDSRFSKPEPTRWGPVAKAFQAAAEALCRGDVQRGQQLVDKALEVERKALDAVSDTVHTDDLEESMDAENPFAEMLSHGLATASEAIPEEIDEIVRQIVSVTREVPDQPAMLRNDDPFWFDEEEEEEEKPEGA